jgi:hypothetical protein
MALWSVSTASWERAPSYGAVGVGESAGPDGPLPHVLGLYVLEEEQAVAFPLIVGLEGGFHAVFFRIRDELLFLNIEEA